MKRVCVTGDKGFIGTHLTQALRKRGFEVEGWDLKDGKDVNNLHSDDLKDGARNTDIIFHLAAFPKVPYSVKHPEITNYHNINGTLQVLRAAAYAKVKRVVFSSSSAIYGNQNKSPLTEIMIPNPMSPYAVQKLTGEWYCKVFSELYELETVSLRYFNVYGEGMPLDGSYSACVAIFLDKRKNGQPLPVFGGEQTRDYVYVEDVVEANILAATSEKVGKGEVINIGSGKNYSINQLAGIIGGEVEKLPQREGEPMDTLADIKKAKNLLNWSPQMDLTSWLNGKSR